MASDEAGLAADSAAGSSALVVYTDGACTGNGKAGAKAGVGVFFGKDDVLNYSAALDGDVQTNQRAEMTAVLKAMTISLGHNRVTQGETLRILTDSNVRLFLCCRSPYDLGAG